MSLKSVFFKLRDGLRFSWARRKYAYIPKGDIAAFDFHKLKHIVILKLDGKLGDTQVMSHFYSQLRNLSNDGQKLFLSVVCPSGLTHIYRDILGFDCVIESSRKPREQEITKICESIKQAARDAGADDTVDLLISTEPAYRPRDFIFNKLLSPAYVAGCDKRIAEHAFAVTGRDLRESASIDKACGGSELSFLLYDVDSYDQPIANVFDSFMKLGKLSPADICYQPLASSQELESASCYLREGGQYGPDCLTADSTCKVIGVNPQGAAKVRTFAPEVTAGILSAIVDSSTNTKALLMCQRKSVEYIEQVESQLSPEKREMIGTRIMLMPENSSVSDLCALIGNLSGMIGVDTATVHIGCAYKLPQLCVYNNCSLNSKQWAPWGNEAKCIFFKDGDMPVTDPKNIIEPARKFIESVVAARA